MSIRGYGIHLEKEWDYRPNVADDVRRIFKNRTTLFTPDAFFAAHFKEPSIPEHSTSSINEGEKGNDDASQTSGALNASDEVTQEYLDAFHELEEEDFTYKKLVQNKLVRISLINFFATSGTQNLTADTL